MTETSLTARFIVADRILAAIVKRGSKGCGKATRRIAGALVANDERAAFLRAEVDGVAALEDGLIGSLKLRCRGCPAPCKWRLI